MELKYRKIRCGDYKYETVGRFVIKTDVPDVKCNEYLSVVDGWMYIEDGYQWDGSSGPAIDTAKCMIASLVHDAYYQMMREECIDRDAWRAYADRQYREICLDAGMWETMANWRYAAIVKFAGKYTYPQPEKKYKIYTVKSGQGKTRRTVQMAAGLLLACCLLGGLLGVAGCPGRTITYTDPNGYQIKYNSNLTASTQAAGTVLVKTPNGWLILVSDVRLNADDLKVWVVPYGGASTTEKAKEILTTDYAD